MGTTAKQNRLQQKNAEVTIEQNSVTDDSLLPPAEELSKLEILQSGTIDWIKRRAEIEQDARIKFNLDRVNILGYEVKSSVNTERMGMIFTFILVLVVILIAAGFVYNGYSVGGTIFGGLGAFVLLGALFKSKKKPKQ